MVAMWKDDDDDEKWNVEKIEDIKYLFDFSSSNAHDTGKRQSEETMWFNYEAGCS